MCFTCLKLHAVAVRRNCHKVIHLQIKSFLITLKDDSAVRDVQNPAHRLVGNIVYLIGRAAPIVNARSLEKSRCRVSGVSPDIAFPYDLLFIDCLVNVMADLTGF